MHRSCVALTPAVSSLAPIELAALAADEGLGFASEDLDGEWRITPSIVGYG